jgi:hypothetical protein
MANKGRIKAPIGVRTGLGLKGEKAYMDAPNLGDSPIALRHEEMISMGKEACIRKIQIMHSVSREEAEKVCKE